MASPRSRVRVALVRAYAGISDELEAAGLEVLFDDRTESPGIKFNDADLLGIPLRITVSPRTLKENSVEVKWRAEKESKLLPLEGLTAAAKQMVSEKL